MSTFFILIWALATLGGGRREYHGENATWGKGLTCLVLLQLWFPYSCFLMLKNSLEHLIVYLLHHIYFGPNFIYSKTYYLGPVPVNYAVAYFMFGPNILNTSFSPTFQFHPCLLLMFSALYCSFLGRGGDNCF